MLLFVVWEIRLRAVVDLPEALRRVQDRYTDLEAARKEHYRARTTLDAAIERMEESRQIFAEIQDSFRKVVEAQHRLEDEMIQRRQELGESQRKAEQWQERAIHYIEGVERALSHDGLSSDYKAAAERGLEEYVRSLEPVGLRLLRPTVGDAFDAKLHEMAGEEAAEGKSPGTVLRCKQWGIMAGDDIVRAAKVVLVQSGKPSEPA
jgi:molecular chaperone GrpE (heat shock protein)